MKLLFKKLSDDAQLPTRGSEHAVGYDLYASEKTQVKFSDSGIQNWCLVKTGLAVAIPAGHYGRVAPRSGLAKNDGLDVLAGVVDPDYRGELGVILINHNHHTFWVLPGMKIAQLVIEKVSTPDAEWATELPDTDRGAKGFGSTGS